MRDPNDDVEHMYARIRVHPDYVQHPHAPDSCAFCEGRLHGFQEGMALTIHTLSKLLMDILAVRALAPMTTATDLRIRACRDVGELYRACTRAVTIKPWVDDLFEDEPLEEDEPLTPPDQG